MDIPTSYHQIHVQPHGLRPTSVHYISCVATDNLQQGAKIQLSSWFEETMEVGAVGHSEKVSSAEVNSGLLFISFVSVYLCHMEIRSMHDLFLFEIHTPCFTAHCLHLVVGLVTSRCHLILCWCSPLACFTSLQGRLAYLGHAGGISSSDFRVEHTMFSRAT